MGTLSQSHREDLVVHWFKGWSESDPQGASGWVVLQPPGKERDRLIHLVGPQLVRRDPSQAARLVELIPPGPLRNQMYSSLAVQWAQGAPQQASEWLDQIPVDVSRDHAVYSFAWTIADTNPDDALSWALSIQDGEMQVRLVTSLSEQWLKKDRTAATAWIQRNLSNEQQGKLLKK
jgi:hypothetical protein